MPTKSTGKSRAKSRSGATGRLSAPAPSNASSAETGTAGSLVYYATITADGEAFGVHFVDLPGCISAGDTFEDAVVNAYDALAMHTASMVADGDALPPPSTLADVRTLSEADAEPAETLQYVPVVSKGAVAGRSPAVRVNITLQESLLAAIDAWAAERGESRSNMLAQAARERMARK